MNDIPIINKYDPLSNSNTNDIVTVLCVDPLRHIAKVASPKGRIQIIGFVTKTGPEGDGENWIPPSGKDWRARVSDLNGESLITEWLPPTTQFPLDTQVDKSTYSEGRVRDLGHTISLSSKKYSVFSVDQNETRLNYRGNKYTDKIGGDWSITSLEGNMIGILRGGVNILKASELCQIQQFFSDDLTRIVSRNFELMTDWGRIDIKNKEGKTNLKVRGVSGRNSSTDVKNDSYEFQFQLGAVEAGENTEDFFCTFEYTTPAKETLLFAIGADGNLVLKLPRDLWVDVKEDLLLTVSKNLGIFSAETMTLDSTKQMLLESLADGSVGPDGKFNKTGEGITYKAYTKNGQKTLEVGIKGKQLIEVTDQKIRVGGDLSGIGIPTPYNNLVTKPHLEKNYNELCSTLFKIFSSPSLGDLGIPLPIAARSQQLDSVVDLLLKLKDNSNTTKSLEGH